MLEESTSSGNRGSHNQRYREKKISEWLLEKVTENIEKRMVKLCSCMIIINVLNIRLGLVQPRDIFIYSCSVYIIISHYLTKHIV